MGSELGTWEVLDARFRYLPIHLALLPTGKVLAFAGSGNDEERERQSYPSELFDPAKGTVTELPMTFEGDVFCAGHAMLADGRVLVAGGTAAYDRQTSGATTYWPFSGLEQAYVFDPWTERWQRVADMAAGRWYPTLVTLGDGRVLNVSGLTKWPPYAFPLRVEVWDRERWRTAWLATRWLPLYPRLHLLPSGHVLYAGAYNTHYERPFTLWFFPTALLSQNLRGWRRVGKLKRCEREEGASVLLPLEPPDYKPKVMLIGGGTPGGEEAEASCEIIEDPAAKGARWTPAPSMHHARYYVYPVLLPDATLLVCGGRSGLKHMHNGHPHPMDEGEVPVDPHAVREAELFDPRTQTWRPLAIMNLDRLYHAGALLLPDATVMVAGSNPRRRVNELHIEIFHPPYLVGTRPVITEAPEHARWGDTLTVGTDEPDRVARVALIRFGATTHCVNTDQRYVGLVFTPTPEGLRAQVPANPNLLPPGYYMLFLVSDEGVPSLARFVRVGA